ncbi:MAG: hypothetical protein Kow0026_16380 [Oricola sp.]
MTVSGRIAGSPALRPVFFPPARRASLAAMLRPVLAILALAAVSSARAEDLSRFAGEYVGCAVSGERWVPIATTLIADGDTLSGSYVFVESSGRRVPGTLSSFAQEAEDRLSFAWTDIYGTGPVRFSFSADGARFDGYWTGDGPDLFPWNGVRRGSGLPRPDCSAPVA